MGAQRERAVAPARGLGEGEQGRQEAAEESKGWAAGELPGRAPTATSEAAVGEHREWAAGGPTGRGAGEHSEWEAGGPTGRGAGEHREWDAEAPPTCSTVGVPLRSRGAGEAAGEHRPWASPALRGCEDTAPGPQAGWAAGEGAEPQTTCEMEAPGTESGVGGCMGLPMVCTTGEHMA